MVGSYYKAGLVGFVLPVADDDVVIIIVTMVVCIIRGGRGTRFIVLYRERRLLHCCSSLVNGGRGTKPSVREITIAKKAL